MADTRYPRQIFQVTPATECTLHGQVVSWAGCLRVEVGWLGVLNTPPFRELTGAAYAQRRALQLRLVEREEDEK